jgi:hypothetical protein
MSVSMLRSVLFHTVRYLVRNKTARPRVKPWYILTIWVHVLYHNYSIVLVQAVFPHHMSLFFKPHHPKSFSVLVMAKRNDRFG